VQQTEQDLLEVKSLLRKCLEDKVVREADKIVGEKAYTSTVFEDWKKEHFRHKIYIMTVVLEMMK
jgi:hypothetical protein